MNWRRVLSMYGLTFAIWCGWSHHASASQGVTTATDAAKSSACKDLATAPQCLPSTDQALTEQQTPEAFAVRASDPTSENLTTIPSPEEYADAAQQGCLSALANSQFFKLCSRINKPTSLDAPESCFCGLFSKNQELFCESLTRGIHDYCRLARTYDGFMRCSSPALVGRIGLALSALAKNCGY